MGRKSPKDRSSKRQADRSNKSRNATSVLAEGQNVVDRTFDRPAPGDFLDQTIAVWQPYTDRPLTREDAREIVQNVVGFFRVLREWAEEERHSDGLTESSSPAAVSGVE